MNIARLILRGFSILGILSGGMLVIAAIGILFEIQREDCAVLCGSLVLSVVLSVIGAYLIYTSYLMLRLRAFAVVTRDIPTLLAACVFIVAERVMSWADTLVSEELSRYVTLSCALVSLLLFYLGISVFTKLSKRLLEAANVRPARDLREDQGKG